MVILKSCHMAAQHTHCEGLLMSDFHRYMDHIYPLKKQEQYAALYIDLGEFDRLQNLA